MNPFQGTCNSCGAWGHTAKGCKKGKGKGVNGVGEEEEGHEQQGAEQELSIGGLDLGGGINALEKSGMHCPPPPKTKEEWQKVAYKKTYAHK